MAEATLRDIIESAVDQTPEQTTDAPAPTAQSVDKPTSEPTRLERVRDDAGRFARTEKPEEQQIEPEPAHPTPSRPPRPSSWKKDYWEKWDALAEQDPQLAEYLSQREQQYAQGVSTYKTEADRAREWNELVTPHAARFQQFGTTPTQYVGRLLQMDQVLSTGTVEQKQAMLNAIAQAVGLQVPTGGQVVQGQPQQAYVPPELLSTVHTLQQKIDAIDRLQQTQQQQAINEEIDEFAKDAPYLDDLIEPMAQLLERGAADSLQEAYRIALAKDESLFQKFLSEQQGSEERKRQDAARQAAERARQSAVSPRSGTPTGSSTQVPQGGSDIRSTVSAAFDSVLGAGGGRI